jgi:hypothetical protein
MGLILGRGKDFAFHLSVQTSSGAHTAPCPHVSGGSFPGIKRPGVQLIIHLIYDRG